MPEERRKYERFSFILEAQREDEKGASAKVRVLEISVTGCFVEWFDDARLGDGFRLKIPLANGNFLPVFCKIIYRFTNIGVGVQFPDLTEFEQDLIAETIRFQMRKQFNATVEPFALPDGFYDFSEKKPETQFVDVA